MKTIKVLSVRQPWAWLIVSGYKNVENRTWKTDHRGELFIHAGQEFDWDALAWLEQFWEYHALVCRHFGIRAHGLACSGKEFGAIVGYADLTDCVRNANSIWAMPGCWHWELHRALPLVPIPLKGQLRIFEVDEKILEVLK